MNKEKKARMKCSECRYHAHCYDGLPNDIFCTKKPEMKIDKFTRQPKWCPLLNEPQEVDMSDSPIPEGPVAVNEEGAADGSD